MLYLLFYILQTGNDKYKLAATSEDGVKKPKKGKKSKKDMEELKKEVELVRNYLQIHSFMLFLLSEFLVGFTQPIILVKIVTITL